MNDMSTTIAPKSDQLNTDDLLAGPRTITIRDVKISPGTEQPVGVFFNGDEGKPYLPCKSMRRVLVAIWGPDASVYSGRSMTLYRDPTVTWGGMEVGGIRISHMSHLAEKTIVVLTATKKSRKPFTVMPLVMQDSGTERRQEPSQGAASATPQDKARAGADRLMAKIAAAETEDALHEIAGSAAINRGRDVIKRDLPGADEEIAHAMTKRFQELSDPLAGIAA